MIRLKLNLQSLLTKYLEMDVLHLKEEQAAGAPVLIVRAWKEMHDYWLLNLAALK